MNAQNATQAALAQIQAGLAQHGVGVVQGGGLLGAMLPGAGLLAGAVVHGPGFGVHVPGGGGGGWAAPAVVAPPAPPAALPPAPPPAFVAPPAPPALLPAAGGGVAPPVAPPAPPAVVVAGFGVAAWWGAGAHPRCKVCNYKIWPAAAAPGGFRCHGCGFYPTF